MHISEGVLDTEILIAGWIGAGALCGWALHKFAPHDAPKVALLSSLFFAGSFVHIPVGATSVHLLLNGLIGALGGIQAFLAIGIALFFQALLYGFGGLGVLGVNTLIMALPPVIVWKILRPYLKSSPNLVSFLGGFAPVLLSVAMLYVALITSDKALNYAAGAILAANLPLMLIEGLISLFALRFILKFRPNLL